MFEMRVGVLATRLVLPASAGMMSFGGTAFARSTGMDGGSCVGCHTQGESMIRLFAEPPSFSPGDLVRLTVELEGMGAEAGLFIDEATGAGTFATVSGGGLTLRGAGLTHPMPRPVTDGIVSFALAWTAPETPDAARFNVYALMANGNGLSSGDRAWSTSFDFVYGCDPQPFYVDFDGDGYGRESDARVFCSGAPPDGYAATNDDCDDNRDTVFPGAPESCNNRDDDCDGAIDNDYTPVMQYPDADGDGFYGVDEALGDDAYLGCPRVGFASESGDCQPNRADIYPGAEEICNLFDDDCDGRVDEFVRPQCGTGWCRRNADTCVPEDCTPGLPMPETCNLLDDDCDDAVDEGDDLCEPGLVCESGACGPPGEGPTSSGDGPMSSGDGLGTSGEAPDDTSMSTSPGGDGGTTSDASPMPDASSAHGGDVGDPPGGSPEGTAPTEGCACTSAAVVRPFPGWLFGLGLLFARARRRRVR